MWGVGWEPCSDMGINKCAAPNSLLGMDTTLSKLHYTAPQSSCREERWDPRAMLRKCHTEVHAALEVPQRGG